MIRHYFLADSLDTTEKVAELLYQQPQFKGNDFHVLSLDIPGLKQHHLHPANLLQRSDLVRGAELGALAGFAIGLGLFCCAVLTMVFWTETSAMIKNTLLIGSVVLPVLLGAGVGASIGVTQESHKISRFHSELKRGQHLLMVDADESQQVAIQQVLSPYRLVDAGADSLLITPFDELAA